MKQTDKKLSLAGLVVILFLNIVVQAQSAITLISAQRDVGVGLFSSPSGSPLPAQDASTASLNYWDQTVSMGPNEPGASFATDYGLATQTSDFGSVSGFSNSTLTSLGSMFGPLSYSSYEVSFTVTEDVRLRVEASGLLFGNVTRGITLLEDNMYVHYDSDVANHSSQVVYDGDFSHLLKAGSTYRLQHWFRVESTPFEDNIAEASMQLSYSIPEPSSTSLLGLGMLGLILRRRR